MIIIKNSNDSLEQSSIHYIKSKFNNFKGWYCDAGKNSLWIYSNGDVFGNACQSIRYGNIYETFNITSSPIQCPMTNCFCGADISITKAKTLEDLKNIKSINSSINFKGLKTSSMDDVVAMIHPRNLKEKNTFTIDWNIGKRCNFNCSYCPPKTHDNHSSHLTLSSFILAFDKLYSIIDDYKTIDIVFTGGEPTINPDYLNIVNYSKRSNTRIFTNTNCTASIDKLEKLMHLGGLYISIHEEFVQHEKTLEKIRFLYDQMIDKDIINIKYMFMPNKLKNAKEFISQLPKKKNNFFISIHPLVDQTKEGKRLDYTSEEIDFISLYDT
jgi:organic radical activating enzyme